MKTKKKIDKTIKAIMTFIVSCKKAFISMKTKLKKIWLCIAIIILATACGSTKVAVQRPAEGTSTTITVTTNNPITTNVNPQVDLNSK